MSAKTQDTRCAIERPITNTMKKNKLFLFAFLLAVLASVNSCKKDRAQPEEPIKPPNDQYVWVDASIQLPVGTNYSLSKHELNAVGEAVTINSSGATKVPKMENSVAIYTVTNEAEEPVLMGYSTPNKTEISPAATAKVTLFNLYRIATLPVDAQVEFLEGFGGDQSADSYIEAFVQHWASNPKTLLNKGYINLMKTYHATYNKNNEVTSAGIKSIGMNKLATTGGSRYYYADADTGRLENGYSLGLESPNKFYIRNKGPGSGTAFIYKTKIKKNNSLNHQVLINTFEQGTKSDRNWFIENGTYRPRQSMVPFGGPVDYRLYSFGEMRFNEVSSGPHELPLADDEEEAEYAIRIVNAGVNAWRDKLTADEFAAYVKHVHAALIMDYYLPFMGINMGLDIHDFYALDPEDRVNKLDAAIRDAGLHTQFNEHLAEGRLPALLEMMENYFQSASTEYGLKLHQAVFKAVGKSGSASMVSAAKRAGYLSYYFDGGLFWDAEREKSLFRDYYWDTYGLITLHATAKAGVVRVSPRKANSTAMAPNNQVELTANIESEEFKDLAVTYKWEIIHNYGSFPAGPNQGTNVIETTGNKATYRATPAPARTETVEDKVIVSVLKDGQLVGKDSAIIHIAPSRYRLTPNDLTLSGNADRGANIATLRIVPADAGAVEIGPNPTVDFMVQWKTAGKHGGLRWQGRYATYWTTETEGYDSPTVQYRCDDDQTRNGAEIVEALIFQKPKGAPESEYMLQGVVSVNINILNDPRKKIFYVPISVISWSSQDAIYTHCGAGTIFYMDPVENAESYVARIIEFSPEVIPRVTGTGSSWNASRALNTEGKYEFGYVLAQAGSSPTWIGPPDCAGFISYASARKGLAQVIVTLKP